MIAISYSEISDILFGNSTLKKLTFPQLIIQIIIMNEYIDYFLNYLQTEKDAAKSASSLGKTSLKWAWVIVAEAEL